MKTVKSNLKYLVNDKGISIRQLSADIDWNFEVVRRLYNDEMERYPRELLERLCEYFNCTVDDILVTIDEEKG